MTQGPLLILLLRFVLSFLGLFLVGTSLWSGDMFGDVSFEQLIYHIQFGFSGLLETDAKSLHMFFVSAVQYPALGAAVLTVVSAVAERLRRPAAPGVARRLSLGLARHSGVLVLLGGLGYFLVAFDVSSYIRSFYGEDVFATAYINPRSVPLVPDARPKSLVLIYVESLENSYQSPKRFGRDLLAPLTRMQKRYASFGSYEQMPGTNWTMAGILSTQCGIPLKILKLPGPEEALGLHMRRFAPRAVCLGDILRAHGYENVFMNGPDLEFAGVGIFLKDHGYDRVYGAREWIRAGEDQKKMKEWGLRDDRLLAHAKTELSALVASGQLFNLTILTVDTHGPDGILSDECRRRAAGSFETIVECTAGQVAELIGYIEAQGWLDRVSIVVQGDHLAMENPVFAQLEANKQRRVFNLIVSRPAEVPVSPRVDHFDMFPTILNVLGFRTASGRLGLGYCMLASCGTARPPEERFGRFEGGILNRSPVYIDLWTG